AATDLAGTVEAQQRDPETRTVERRRAERRYLAIVPPYPPVEVASVVATEEAGAVFAGVLVNQRHVVGPCGVERREHGGLAVQGPLGAVIAAGTQARSATTTSSVAGSASTKP